MLHIALYRPEIPPNTGNIIRLCANSGVQLHLIYPLGFRLEDKQMRRAGLDYHEYANIIHYQDTNEFLKNNQHRKIFACSTKGHTTYTHPDYKDENMFLFGSETAGLPDKLHQQFEIIKIPMKFHSRSLNLSNSVAIILFEAWRQLNFCEF